MDADGSPTEQCLAVPATQPSVGPEAVGAQTSPFAMDCSSGGDEQQRAKKLLARCVSASQPRDTTAPFAAGPESLGTGAVTPLAAVGSIHGDDEAGEKLSAEKLAYCRSVRESFHGLFGELVQALSLKDLNPIFEQVRGNENTLNGDECLDMIRDNLQQALIRDHDTFWESQCVNDSLSCLQDMLAASYQHKSNEQPKAGWRPTGRSVEEQLRFYKAFLLRSKIAYLQKQNKGQLKKHQELITEVEAGRARIEAVQQRRDQLQYQMTLTQADIQKGNEDLRRIHANMYRDESE